MKTIGTCENCKWWKPRIGSEHADCENPKNDEASGLDDGANPDNSMEAHCWIEPGPNFGCVHWEAGFVTFPDSGSLAHLENLIGKIPTREPHPNYPPSTLEQRKIDDLQRECDCAARKIEQLSAALSFLGYDPTQCIIP